MSRDRSLLHAAALAVTGVGAAVALGGAVMTLRNLRWMQRRRVEAEHWTPGPGEPATTVSVLLPARDEESRVAACAAALSVLEGLDAPTAAGTRITEVLVLDDNSSDGTADVVRAALGERDEFGLLHDGQEPPAGWLGKPWACQRLAEHAHGDVLVFVDADVVLEPHAVDAAVRMLNCHRIAATCPYPRQIAVGTLGRLIQPLLQWSWLSTVDLASAESSTRRSTATGNGQFLAVRSEAYWAAGGHASVRGDVLEDLALIRELRSLGASAGVSDGTDLATCTMYDSSQALVDGYTKSLWSAFGSTPGAIGAVALLKVAYLVPPIAAVLGHGWVRAAGIAGTLGALASRSAAAVGTEQRLLPDVLAHPASIAAFAWLTGASIVRHRSGTNAWKGRPVHHSAAGPAGAVAE